MARPLEYKVILTHPIIVLIVNSNFGDPYLKIEKPYEV